MAEMEKKKTNWKKEVKLSLFADNTILYIENPKYATRKQLTNEFGKVEGHKLRHRNILHSYKVTMKDQKEKLGEKIPFTISSKIVKYPGIKLPKET